MADLLEKLLARLAIGAVLITVVATVGSASDTGPRPVSPFKTAPVWINRLVVVDFVSLGYISSDCAYGMRFEGDKYLGRYSLYTNWEIAEAILMEVLVRPDRIRELAAKHPVIFAEVRKATEYLALVMREIVDVRDISQDDMADLAISLLLLFASEAHNE